MIAVAEPEIKEDEEGRFGWSVGSLWRLQQRCLDEVHRRLDGEAQLECCIAATEICGVPETDWVDGMNSLMELQRELRREAIERLTKGDKAAGIEARGNGTWDAALMEADAALVERIDYAIRRWERLAVEETTPEETMVTATKRRAKKKSERTIEAWYDEHGQLHWRCPQCKNEHGEEKRACGCEYVRPPLERLQAVAKAAEAAGIPATQEQAQEKEAAAGGWPVPLSNIGSGIESIILTFRPESRCKAAIDLKQEGEVWFDRVTWSTEWKEHRFGGITEALDEHVPGEQSTREDALRSALTRLMDSMTAVQDRYLTTVGQAARILALEDLAHESERLLQIPPANGHARNAEALDSGLSTLVSHATDEFGGELLTLSDGTELQVTLEDVPLDLIDWRSDNPRQSIDPAYIDDLAESIKQNGLQHRVVLRRLPAGRFEGWQGSSRTLACRALDRKTIPAKVYPAETPDAHLVRGRADENLRRKDLNPIERAESLRQLLASHGWDPQREGSPSLRSLAPTLGVSQAELSQTLKLLELPAEWREKLITGVITPTQARFLAPWIDRPAVLKAVAEELEHGPQDEWTTADFESVVAHVIEDLTAPCEPKTYIGYVGGKWRGGRDVQFTEALLEQHAADLDLVKVKLRGKKEERRAFNLKAWEKLHKPLEKKAEEAAVRKQAGVKSKGKGSTEPTAAELKEKAKEQQRILDTRVSRYKVRWLQQRASLRVKFAGEPLVIKLLLYFLGIRGGSCSESIGRALPSAGGKTKKGGYGLDVWPSLSSIATDGIQWELARHLVAEWLLQETENWRAGLRASDVPAIAEELGVDFAEEWTCDEEFLGLFTKDQLGQLAKEWKAEHYVARTGLQIAATSKRSEIIDGLLDCNREKPFPVPKILQKAKA